MTASDRGSNSSFQFVSPLALTAGARLGVHEVIVSIGVGGMSEVYRATDTTLGRQVAIKILPDAFAADYSANSRRGLVREEVDAGQCTRWTANRCRVSR